MRHQAVAERIFDEMERGLSRLLDGEEERPFERYGVETRTPRELPFVVGHFQIDPDGGVRALAVAARAAGGARRSSSARRRLLARRRGAARTGRPRRGQLPGTTVDARRQGTAAPAPAAAANAREQLAAQKEVSAFDALRSLNKGALERAERQRKASGVRRTRRSSRDRGAARDDRAASRRRLHDAADRASSSSRDRASADDRSGRRRRAPHALPHGGARERRPTGRACCSTSSGSATWLREQGLGGDGLAALCARVVRDALRGRGARTPRDAALRLPASLRRAVRRPDARGSRCARCRASAASTYVYALSALLLATGVLGLGGALSHGVGRGRASPSGGATSSPRCRTS